MSNPKDYNVGWICAISAVYVAAQAFLDDEHDGAEYVSPNDNNDYTLGKVGKHNVVIPGQMGGHNVVVPFMPSGVYGATSVATVATSMLCI
jgi:hypothetical protein